MDSPLISPDMGSIAFHVADNGLCPYLNEQRWQVEEFAARHMDPAVYESLLALGFRRSGFVFYRNRCEDCEHCLPIRLDAATFKPSKSQRKVARRNTDISVRTVPAEFSEERYALYQRYLAARHAGEAIPTEAGRAEYASFLLANPLPQGLISEYRRPDGQLLATGYLDVLPGGLSSVYFAFEPEAGERSLGVWSVARELELAVSLGKRYYYLGFWVSGSRKMDYKADHRPFEFASGATWHCARDRAEALAALGTA